MAKDEIPKRVICLQQR